MPKINYIQHKKSNNKCFLFPDLPENDYWESLPSHIKLMLQLAKLQYPEKNPQDIVVFEPCPSLSHRSEDITRDLGFRSIAPPCGRDILEMDKPPTGPGGVDIVVTNPPFSDQRKFLEHFYTWYKLYNIPFVLLLPDTVMREAFFLNVYMTRKEIQIVYGNSPTMFIDPQTNKPTDKFARFNPIFVCCGFQQTLPRVMSYDNSYDKKFGYNPKSYTDRTVIQRPGKLFTCLHRSLRVCGKKGRKIKTKLLKRGWSYFNRILDYAIQKQSLIAWKNC